MHATPLPAGGTHWPAALHLVPDTQSVSVAQEVAQTLELAQRYGAQLREAPQVVETPLQAGTVATPFEQAEPPEQEVPAGTMTQVPRAPGCTQDWQAPVQGLLQQTPLTQKPPAQSVEDVQVPPAVSWCAVQRRAASISACPAAVRTEAVVSSRKTAARRSGAVRPTIATPFS